MKGIVRERQVVATPLARPQRMRWWVPVLAFVVVAAVLWAVAGLSAMHLARTEQYSPAPASFPGGPFFEAWARWDAWWYRSIVEDGYVYYKGVQSSVAFWPSYPLVLAAFEPISPSPLVTGPIVTLVSGLTAAVLFYVWCADLLGRKAATTSVLLLLVFPFAWFLYGPVYADAFCLAAVLAAFVALERDRLWLAGLLGLVASAARPVGLVVAVALVLRLLERRNAVRAELLEPVDTTNGAVAPDGATVPPVPWGMRVIGRIIEGGRRFLRGLTRRFSRRGFSWADAPVLLAFGGVGLWCAYLWVRFDDPLLWEHIQSVPGWDQGSGPATWFKSFLVDQMLHDASSPFTWSKAAQGVLAIGMLALVPRIARRLGWAYALLTAGVILLPVIGTKDFMGTGRYLLAAFPVFAVAGEWLADRPRLRVVVVGASAIVLVFLTSLFARGHYLA